MKHKHSNAAVNSSTDPPPDPAAGSRSLWDPWSARSCIGFVYPFCKGIYLSFCKFKVTSNAHFGRP